MADPTPIACSLDAGQLRERLAEIETIGAEALVEKTHDGERHVLRFRADAKTERRLEEIVVAESRCCAFLDLELRRHGDVLILTVAAPEAGAPVAEELALTFAGGTAR